MTVAGEEIVYKLTVDGRSAEAELKSFGASMKSVGGYAAQTAEQLANFEYKMKAADVATGGVGGSLKALRPTLAASAASISLVASAMGDQAGAAGKVINLGGQMLAAYGAGGPYGLALAAGVTGVSLLTQKWDELIQKEDEALTKQFLGVGDAGQLLNKVEADLAEIHANTLTGSAKVFAQVQGEIDAVANKAALARKGLLSDADVRRLESLKAAGMTAGGQDPEGLLASNENRQKEVFILDKVNEKLQRKQALQAALAGQTPDIIGKQDELAAEQAKTEMDRYHSQISALLKAKGDADKELARSTFETQKEIDDATDAAYKARLEKRASDEQELIEQSSAVYEQQLEGQKEADALADEEYEAHIQRDIAAQKRLSDAQAELAQTSIDAIEGGISTATNAFAGYFAMRAAGEKYAAEKSTAAFMSGIGQQLVGIGLKSEFSGAAKLFDPVTLPIGIAEMAFGAGAIGVGIALGAKGAGISASVATKEKADENQAKGADAGARGRSGGSLGSGGNGSGRGFTVNNYYGVGGPQADDNARRMRDLLRLAARRGFT